jgi:hypothetical protein
MAQHLAELEELTKDLPPLLMDAWSRHMRDDHRKCPPNLCIKWGYDLRLAPVFMDVWLDHPASSIL